MKGRGGLEADKNSEGTAFSYTDVNLSNINLFCEGGNLRCFSGNYLLWRRLI